MRTLLVLPGLLFLVACHGPSAVPPAIQTSARGPLRGEVEQEIRDLQQLHHGDCPAARIVSARILDGGREATQELWTLEGCGRTFRYDVTVSHEEMGGQISVHEREADAGAQP
ncbi:MAG TPA: hypothetical protein VFT46_01215 [Holophagaceae bacterium]|nr:hypothetical protein [Holophagaceae bacterium]